MAIYTTIAPVDEIAGSIGGSTFSRNAFGPYVKRKATGVQPRTPLQTAQRALLSQNATNWANITTAERTGWGIYAALPAQELFNIFGVGYFIPGFAWFIKINLQLASGGFPPRTAAPTLVRLPAPTVAAAALRTTLSGVNSGLFLTGGTPTILAVHVLQGVILNSIGPQVRAHNLQNWIVEVPTPPFFVIFQDEIEAIYGDIIDGQKGFFTVAAQDTDGQRGPSLSFALDAVG